MKAVESKIRCVGLWKHIGVDNTSVLCLEKMFGEPCPICERARELRASGAGSENAND